MWRRLPVRPVMLYLLFPRPHRVSRWFVGACIMHHARRPHTAGESSRAIGHVSPSLERFDPIRWLSIGWRRSRTDAVHVMVAFSMMHGCTHRFSCSSGDAIPFRGAHGVLSVSVSSSHSGMICHGIRDRLGVCDWRCASEKSIQLF